MGSLLRRYATATASGTHVGIPMIKAGAQDFAAGSDWVPAAGDVKVSIDGGAQANIATLPAYTNGQWLFQLSAPETTGKSVRVVVVDSATKAVEDQFFVIETFGHASAMFVVDYTDAAAFGLSRLDAAVSSRSVYAGGAVASVTAPVTVGANDDKVGYALSAAGLDAVTAAEPTGPTSGYNFRQLLRWLVMRFENVGRTPTVLTVKTRANATATTQPVADDGAGTESTGVTS